MDRRNDLDNWRRAYELRNVVVSQFRKLGSGYEGHWSENPILNFCSKHSALDELGFKILELPPCVWRDWEGFDDHFDSEVAVIIANPKTLEERISDIHYHQGDVILTGLGKSFGFSNPDGILFRGKLESHIFLDPNSKVVLDKQLLYDNSVHTIQSLEPHGTYVPINGLSIFLAVTCGQRFNDNGRIDAVKIDPVRCRLAWSSQNVSLRDYIFYISN
jgi:hypothetical protein